MLSLKELFKKRPTGAGNRYVEYTNDITHVDEIFTEIQSFQAFPVDIFRIILNFWESEARGSEIVALMGTCRLMRHLLEPVLYTCVIFKDFQSLERFPKAFRTARKYTQSIVILSLQYTRQEARIIHIIINLLQSTLARLCIPPGYQAAFTLTNQTYMRNLTIYREESPKRSPIRCMRLRIALPALFPAYAPGPESHELGRDSSMAYAFEMAPDAVSEAGTTVDLKNLLSVAGLEEHCHHLRLCIAVIYLPNSKAVKLYRNAYRSLLNSAVRLQWPFGTVVQRLRVAFLLRREFSQWTVLSLEARGEDFWDKITARLEL